MDLREFKKSSQKRHPWERSRIYALKQIIKKIPITDYRVLDIGCGDGYVCRELFKNHLPRLITGVDTHLTPEQIKALSEIDEHVHYVNKLPPETADSYNLILMLDVIEHIEDDISFLKQIASQPSVQNGYFLITVPAFPWLFSGHDKFLGHYRRYYLSELNCLANISGMKCLASGYLFTSLLFPRFFSLCFQRIFKISPVSEYGIGGWNYNNGITKTIELWLRLDNSASLFLNKIGIKLPGLTAWILCKKL